MTISIKKIWKQVTFLGVSKYENTTVLVYRVSYLWLFHYLYAIFSQNSEKFDAKPVRLTIRFKNQKTENIQKCSDFSLYTQNQKYLLSYIRHDGSNSAFVIAESSDKEEWIVTSETYDVKERAIFIRNYDYKNNIVLIYGEHALFPAFFKDKTLVYNPQSRFISPLPYLFDRNGLRIIETYYNKKYSEICILYETYSKEKKTYAIGSVILDAFNPSKILWRSQEPLVEIESESQPSALGATITSEAIRLYILFGSKIRIATCTYPAGKKSVGTAFGMHKHQANPILAPKSESHFEAHGAFNPAVFTLDDNIHILYRALSQDGCSSIGHAVSKDGVTIHERSQKPVYVARKSFEGAQGKMQDPYTIASGGGWGGCEDPKVVHIDDRIYLTYVAFNGTWPERTAISSIATEDFKKRIWNWSEPALLSPDIIGNKSACILPEKVNGKFAIFHRVWPDILVDYVDDLDFLPNHKWLHCTPCVHPDTRNGKVVVRRGTWPDIREEETVFNSEDDLIKSEYWKEITKDTKRISARPHHWDSHKISMGSSPIKTSKGWLALYSAVDKRDFSKYKMGAMLLDLKEPHKVLYRSEQPVITPSEWYENDGKPGIVYPGSLVVKDEELLLYYGGGDKVTCLAHAPLNTFLDNLIHQRKNLFSLLELESVTL